MGWRVPIELSPQATFDYWHICQDFVFRFMIRIDLSRCEEEVEAMLEQTWDPGITTNPHAFFPSREVFAFVRRTTSRSNHVWMTWQLAVWFDMMMVGSANTVVPLFEKALRRLSNVSSYSPGLSPAWTE